MDVCLEKADEIMHEDAVAEDMSLTEWLERLNLAKYLFKFRKNKVQTLFDLRHAGDEKVLIEEFKIDET